MPLFHKKPVKRSCFIYHDESGVVGTRGVFIVGLLFVKDNFIFYVKDSINNNIQPLGSVIKHLQAIDSKKDDIMQIADLIIGAINNKVTGNRHPLKVAVRQVVEVEFGKKIRYRDWSFTK